MLFFKGKEDMGLEASLKLLDLPPDATVDDANQAYGHLHRMIDRFHQDAGAGVHGDRQEDLDLLVCAYEKAVAYLSHRDPDNVPASAIAPSRLPVVDGTPSQDLPFTMNLSAEAENVSSLGDAPSLPEPNARTVEDAISITSRRMQQTESALPAVQQAVESATATMEAAKYRYERSRQATLTALVFAASAKNRAMLLEIEAKRALQDAIAVAVKARGRVAAARQAAKEAADEAEKAKKKASRVKKSEETAAAEAVCAEDRLEKETVRLKALTHTLVEVRSRMRMFQDTTTTMEKQNAGVDVPSSAMSEGRYPSNQAVEGETIARQQIMSDLLEIEASLKARNRDPEPSQVSRSTLPGAAANTERRQHHRVSYPAGQCPWLSIDGRTIPVLDLSTVGMRLEPDAAMAGLRLVRGVITFPSRSPVKVTGKVVRQDDTGLGLKLVTRIGNHILDQERLRLGA
ncbi:PilZ domain-containing protein [Desulfosarcina sp.]|uniref:PilZ domain-containing protein n=1 Tax=Desulfosarcina sp. TaxID=2027861 RepID=UPI00356603BB